MLELISGMILSFDDGVSKNTKYIGDFLFERNVKANFYLIGNTIEDNKEIVKGLYKQGHKICNHTYSHKDLTSLKPIKAYLEIAKGSLLIKKATGKIPNCFRPPFGKTNSSINSFAEGVGMDIHWSLGTGVFDTMDRDTNTDPVERLKKYLTKEYKEVLMHDNSKHIKKELDFLFKKNILD